MALLGDLEAAQQAQEPNGFWPKLLHRLARVTGQATRADWQDTLSKAATFLEEHAPRPPTRHVDPPNLPRRSLRPPEQPLLPKLTPEAWRQAFPQESRATGSVPGKAAEAPTEAPTTRFAAVPSPRADIARTVGAQEDMGATHTAQRVDRPLTFVPIDLGRIPGSGSVT